MSEQPLRVLLIDDDEDYFVIVRDLLSEVQGFRTELKWLDSYEKGLAVIGQNHTDVFIVDYRLGAHNGLDLLNEALSRNVLTPFILLTGQGDQEIAVEAMKAGAVDYLIKGQVNAPLLERSLRHALESSQNRQLVRRMIEILETTSDLVASCDTNHFLTYLNAAGRRMVGIGAEEDISGLTVNQCHPPESAVHIFKTGMPTADREGHWNGEAVLRSRDGREIPVLQAIVAHKASDGRTEYYSTTARDITERKRAEESLREAETKYRVLAEESFLGVYMITENGFEYMNEACARIFGYAPSEVVGRLQVGDMIDPEDVPRVGENVRRRLQGAVEAVHYEFRGRRKDGSLVRCEVFGRRIDYRSRPAILGTLLDVTERKRTEEQLRLQSMALESAANGIVITDADGTIRWVNPAFTKLTGYTAEEAIGKNPRLLKSGKQSPEFYAELWRVIKAGSVWRGEIVNRRKDGSHYDEEMTITPVHNGDGKISQFIAIKQDITERKKAEELLQQTNRRLRDALDELKNAEDKVIQQERLRALGTMASGIAHDFNNALAAILGFSELLIHRPENLDDKERTLRFLKILNTTARDAGNVVNRLREFYRHREESDMATPVDINELIEESVSLTQPRWMTEAQAKGIAIEVRTELQDLPTIPGNAPELREALTNLIFNAVDAMPRGGIITLRTHWDKEHVVLEVADTGSGMTEEVRRRCLEPFFSTKGKRGTGLGLSTVYGTVRRHEGRIDIKTELGKGTSFLVHLPVQSTRILSESIPNEETALPVSPVHVLVVDDETLVREVIAEYLKADGHTVDVAANGQDGLEKFEKGNFDLVLVDRAMPGMNGDQVAAGIKSANPKVPVIMLTGFGAMMLAADEKPAGVDFVVGKPVTINDLRDVLAKAVHLAH
jgi:PAS domain S-box-containing protein